MSALTRRPDPGEKITFGQMREGGTSGILIGCNSCGRHKAIDGARWPDHVHLSDIEPRLICQACGARGATVRPDFAPPQMGIRRNA